AYCTTWALVRMRLPAMTVPLAVISVGSLFVHGLAGSGERSVAKIFTIEFSTLLEGIVASADCAAPVVSGSGDGGETLGSAAKPSVVRATTNSARMATTLWRR